jgi:hypothetical protein
VAEGLLFDLIGVFAGFCDDPIEALSVAFGAGIAWAESYLLL